MIRKSNKFFKSKAVVILSFILFGSALLLGIGSSVYFSELKDRTENLQTSFEEIDFQARSEMYDTYRVPVPVKSGVLVAHAETTDYDLMSANEVEFAILGYVDNIQETTHKLESMVLLMLSFILLLSFLLICSCLILLNNRRKNRFAKRGGDVSGKTIHNRYPSDDFSKLVNIIHSKLKSVRH